MRYSDIEGQRPCTLHRLCCKAILFDFLLHPWYSECFSFLLFWKWLNVPTIPNNLVASVQPPTPTPSPSPQHRPMLPRMTSHRVTLWWPRLKAVVCSLACWGCRGVRLYLPKTVGYLQRPVHPGGEKPSCVSNAVTMPVYLCKSLQCTYVHNFVKKK